MPSVFPILTRHPCARSGFQQERGTGSGVDEELDGTEDCVMGFFQGMPLSFDEDRPGSLLQIPKATPCTSFPVTSLSGAGA